MADEQILREWKAGRPLGRGLAKGQLQLTKTHVVFEPGGMSKRLDGVRFAVSYKFLKAVGAAPGAGGWLSGGKRDRLCLTLGDGSQWFFLVSDLDDAVQAIGAKMLAS